jgi:hypothetical protein
MIYDETQERKNCEKDKPQGITAGGVTNHTQRERWKETTEPSRP